MITYQVDKLINKSTKYIHIKIEDDNYALRVDNMSGEESNKNIVSKYN